MKKKAFVFIRFLLCICVALAMVLAGSGAEMEYVAAEESTTIPEGYTPIYTIDDLYAINDNMSGNYILMNDIDMTDDVAKDALYDFQGNGWMPIGGGSTYAGGEFSGIFDGNGHTISGLRIEVTDWSAGVTDYKAYLGLFAYNSGTIKNVTVKSGKISNSLRNTAIYAGTICGYNAGTISNCHSFVEIDLKLYDAVYDGKIYCLSYIGGIAGRSGTISYSSNAGSINVAIIKDYVGKNYDTYIGGIAGYASAVSYSYNIGNISSTTDGDSLYINCGGILGGEGSVSNCYNAGIVQGGGIVGYGPCTNCYSLSDGIGSGKLTYCYYKNDGTSQTDAVALSDAQMKSKVRFSGFDFDTVWYIDSTSHYPYPQLRDNPHVTATVEHVYDDGTVVTPATCVATGLKRYTCTVCGETKDEVLPIDSTAHGAERTDSESGNVYCSLCGALIREASNETEISTDEKNFVLEGVSATLDEAIELNFYLGVPTATDTYIVTFKQRENSKTVTLTDSLLTTVNEKSMYKVSYPLNAKEINDDVTISIKNNKGFSFTLYSDAGTEYGATYSVSAADYLKTLSGKDDKTTALVNALLDYGNSAQTYFGYYTDDVESVSDSIAAVTAGQMDSTAYGKTGTIVDFDYFGSSLVLESKVTIRHYFSASDAAKYDGYTFKVNGTEAELKTADGFKYIEISNIMPTQLDDTYTLEIIKDDATVYTVKYSTDSYAYDVVNRSDNSKLVNLVKALHLYNVAANTYAAS